MTTFTFTDYSIQGTFGGSYEPSNFKNEIEASSLNTSQTIIDTGSTGNNITLLFEPVNGTDTSLSAPEILVLDGLVVAHSAVLVNINIEDITFKNKILDCDNNTVTNIADAEIKAGASINTSKLADGSVSNTEFQYLDGVTSSIQTQLTGRVLGAGTVIDNSIVRFDSTTGLVIQQSGITIDDNDFINNPSGMILKDVSAPSNPGAGLGTIYKKTGNDGVFWKPDAAGSEVDLTTSGISDHTLLSNIGTNTHSQIDTHISTGNIHIDHSGVLLNTLTNSGLSGGGSIAASRTFAVDVNNLTTAATVDSDADTMVVYDDSTSSTVKTTIRNMLNLASQLQFVELSNEISTSAETFQTGLTLTTTPLAAGTYYIQCYYQWRYSSGSNDFVARVQIDNVTTIHEHQQEPKDTGSDQIYTQCVPWVGTLTSGVHTIDLDYRRNSNGTARLYTRRIILQRVL
jgi:hypothetical protein